MSAKEAAIFNAAQQICDEWDEIWAVGTDGRASQERVIEIISAHQHPADDGEAVTEEKIMASPGVRGCKKGSQRWYISLEKINPYTESSVLYVPHGTTVCQFRRLLDALGVTT